MVSFRQPLEPNLANFYAIKAIFGLANGQILKTLSSHLVTLVALQNNPKQASAASVSGPLTLKDGQFPVSFLFVISTQLTANKYLLTTGFELQTSGVESNYSAATIAHR